MGRRENVNTLIHDHNARGIHNSVESMGDGEDGCTLELGSNGLLDECICLCIHTISFVLVRGRNNGRWRGEMERRERERGGERGEKGVREKHT